VAGDAIPVFSPCNEMREKLVPGGARTDTTSSPIVFRRPSSQMLGKRAMELAGVLVLR
jgi:hypothetical protein